MKLTNLTNLPDPLFQAIAKKSYDKGDADYSITELTSPPRKRALMQKHYSSLTEDALDRIWSFLGTIVHGILEKTTASGLKEMRYYANVEGVRITGQVDYYQDGKISDYKFTTLTKFKGNGVPKDYEEQVNCYAYLMRCAGHGVSELEIVGILRDWSIGMFERSKPEDGYPPKQVVVRSVPMWSHAQCEKFITERIRLHEMAKIELPLCTDSERWKQGKNWAVMKKGQKNAVRGGLHETESDAFDFLSARDDSELLRIERRPVFYAHCERYCPVSAYCTQFKEDKEAEKQLKKEIENVEV